MELPLADLWRQSFRHQGNCADILLHSETVRPGFLPRGGCGFTLQVLHVKSHNTSNTAYEKVEKQHLLPSLFPRRRPVFELSYTSHINPLALLLMLSQRELCACDTVTSVMTGFDLDTSQRREQEKRSCASSKTFLLRLSCHKHSCNFIKGVYVNKSSWSGTFWALVVLMSFRKGALESRIPTSLPCDILVEKGDLRCSVHLSASITTAVK